MKDLISWWKEIRPHKVIEIQLSILSKRIDLGFTITTYWDCDHPGWYIHLNMLCVFFSVSYYDTRHIENLAE